MKLRQFIFTVLLGVLGLVGTAQAGHLFTQGGNPAVPLTAGNGVDLTQASVLAFQSQANPSFFVLSSWGSGDVMRIIFNGFTETFAFDALPAGWINGTFGVDTNGATTVVPAFAALVAPGTPFVWRIEALAGAFTLDGYGLRISNAVVNGRGAQGFAVNPNAVPEPGTLILFGLGLAGIGLARRRREKT